MTTKATHAAALRTSLAPCWISTSEKNTANQARIA
jgi:hypothetical protein